MGSQEHELLSPRSWGVPLSQHVDGFTNPEVHEPHTIEIFMEALSYRHDQLLIPLSALPLPGE